MTRKNRILIVDDMETNLQLLKNYLKEEEYLVATVNSAKAALSKLRSHEFDLILLDVVMPGVNGIELCKELKNNDLTKHIPVIFLTAVSSDTVIIEAFEAGGVDYIKKPFNPDELKRKISNHLQLINYRKELELAKEEAELANKAKSNFLSNVSHELRTPLNGLVSTLELLGETNLDDKQKELHKIASESADWLTHILNDLLDLTKIESGTPDISYDDFNLHSLINDTISFFGVRAREKGLTLEKSISPLIPQTLNGDKYRTKQVLNKLIDNALKFSNAGTVKISADLEQKTDEEIIVKFSVADQGKGISDYHRRVIFDDFTQVDDKLNRKTTGLGVGLALAKRIVKMMGGEIGVESELNKGSTFYFTVKYNKPAGLHEDFIDDISKIKFKTMKALVVDDNAINLKVAKMMLESLGLDVLLAENGLIALEKYVEEKPEIIFMDIQMPIIDGIETTQRIRQIETKNKVSEPIPVIALTASAMKGDKELFINAGMNDFIAKPFRKQDMIRVLSVFGKGLI